jgi:hypothetical protein
MLVRQVLNYFSHASSCGELFEDFISGFPRRRISESENTHIKKVFLMDLVKMPSTKLRLMYTHLNQIFEN